MTFISQTRLLRTASQSGGVVTQIIPPQQVARFPGIVRDIGNAFAALASVPPADQQGGYELRYDLRCCIFVDVSGVRNDTTNLMVVFYDLWHTAADRTAGQPPLVRESHQMGLSTGLNQNQMRQALVRAMEERVLRISLSGELGDLRDPRLVALVTQTDPSGVLDKVRALKDTVRNVDQTDTTAPLLPNPEAV